MVPPPRMLDTLQAMAARGHEVYSDEKVANRGTKVRHGATELVLE
jgi:hypothetical protein